MVHERINFQSKVENNWEKVGPLGGNPSFHPPPRPLYTQIPRLTFCNFVAFCCVRGRGVFHWSIERSLQLTPKREIVKVKETTKFKHVRGGGGWEERDIKDVCYLKRGSCDIP